MPTGRMMSSGVISSAAPAASPSPLMLAMRKLAYLKKASTPRLATRLMVISRRGEDDAARRCAIR